MSCWFIYALRDPITWDVRYVGKTSGCPIKRLRKHCDDAHKHDFYNARWLQKMLRYGAVPLLEILQKGSGDGINDAERYWIAEYRRRGAKLNNATDGGDGALGLPCSPEAKAKIRAFHTGRKRPPESIARMSAAHRGKKQSPETIAKRSAAMMGHPVSKETTAKIVATKLGKPRKPETKARISASLTGKTLSEETKAKLRVSQAARRAREVEAKRAPLSAPLPEAGTLVTTPPPPSQAHGPAG